MLYEKGNQERCENVGERRGKPGTSENTDCKKFKGQGTENTCESRGNHNRKCCIVFVKRNRHQKILYEKGNKERLKMLWRKSKRLKRQSCMKGGNQEVRKCCILYYGKPGTSENTL
ncbi:hypothetical protein AVEN_173283-1 [Araneus ventricosus]|uniref:Uncharacterized protein n=1 Tax=Araneus ventricosus TaxID=182803 RepID=A0A4Y2R519_ARAVE|nr:hypothetical protein AVEN_173283-1 [Araneus ventricosus]